MVLKVLSTTQIAHRTSISSILSLLPSRWFLLCPLTSPSLCFPSYNCSEASQQPITTITNKMNNKISFYYFMETDLFFFLVVWAPEDTHALRASIPKSLLYSTRMFSILKEILLSSVKIYILLVWIY